MNLGEGTGEIYRGTNVGEPPGEDRGSKVGPYDRHGVSLRGATKGVNPLRGASIAHFDPSLEASQEGHKRVNHAEGDA